MIVDYSYHTAALVFVGALFYLKKLLDNPRQAVVSAIAFAIAEAVMDHRYESTALPNNFFLLSAKLLFDSYFSITLMFVYGGKIYKKFVRSVDSYYLHKTLPNATWKELIENDDVCSICLEEMNYGETVLLSCNHIYHRECITRAASYSDECPLCRVKLS